MTKNLKNENGFTLIELVVAAAVMAVLVATISGELIAIKGNIEDDLYKFQEHQELEAGNLQSYLNEIGN